MENGSIELRRFLTLSPATAASAPNNSLFLDTADNQLKQKDTTGGVSAVGGALTADYDYYIDPAGSDVTGDGSVGLPWATFTHALSRIPKNMNEHYVNINVNNGTYNEDNIQITGFLNGFLTIYGTNSDPSLVTVNGAVANGGLPLFNLFSNTADIQISFMTLNVQSQYSSTVTIEASPAALCFYLLIGKVGVITDTLGINVYNSNCTVSLCADAATPVDIGVRSSLSSFVNFADVSPFGTIPVGLAGGVVTDSNSFVYTKETAPTLDYQVANKKYVDDFGLGASGYSGYSGVTGSSTSGYSGYSGVTGSSTSGYSGYSGGAGAYESNRQLFTSSGTWTCPTGITKVIVTVVGGGAGGASSAAAGNGGGGGGGGATVKGACAVTATTGYTVTVGSHGDGGTAGNSQNQEAGRGAAGGDSSFAGDDITLTALGGGRCPLSSAGLAGSGGAITSNNASLSVAGNMGFNQAGGNGGNGSAAGGSYKGGGGGGSMFGKGATGSNQSVTGATATIGYGAAGSGAGENGGSYLGGGSGLDGIVIVEW